MPFTGPSPAGSAAAAPRVGGRPAIVDRARFALYDRVALPVLLPHDASLNGHRVDGILAYLTVTTGVMFAVMAAVFVVAILFHRGRSRVPFHTHGDRWRDRLLAAAAGAAVLIGIDAVAVVRSSQHLREFLWRYPDADPRAVRVEVTAQQWAWTFRHAGRDGRFDTADDLVTLNELRIPVGHPISLQLTSKDVVHSMYLPNFRNKIDAIPGTVTRMWFEARETGAFEIGCAQHCGAWHYKMRGILTVMTDGEFEEWAERAAAETTLQASGSAGGSGDAPGGTEPKVANGASRAEAAAVPAAPSSGGGDPGSRRQRVDAWPWKPLR